MDKIQIKLDGIVINEITKSDTILLKVKDITYFDRHESYQKYKKSVVEAKHKLEEKHNCQVLILPDNVKVEVIRVDSV